MDEIVESEFSDVVDLGERILKALKEEVVESLANFRLMILDEVDRGFDRARAQAAEERHEQFRHLIGKI